MGRGISYSYHYRQRRRRKQRRGFLLFAGILLLVICLGMVVQPWSATQNRAERKTVLDASDDSVEAFPPAPITPGANASGDTLWPLNPYNADTFALAWQRLDGPIKANRTVRDWAFGASPGPSFLEQYRNSQQGVRLVQYWDKGRMQALDPAQPPSFNNYVTYGSLVAEMLEGRLAVGDKETLPMSPPATAVIGDAQGNPAPTYAALSVIADKTGQSKKAISQLDMPVTATLDRFGNIGSGADSGLGQYSVKIGRYVEQTGHNLPSVFFDYLNRNGTIFQNGNFEDGKLFEWQTQFGNPLSEAYWVKATINGKLFDVLLQAFEKQILFFIPTNSPEYQIITAEVGRHYYEWRYPGYAFAPVQKTNATATAAQIVIGNESVTRIVSIESGRLVRSTLVNRLTGQTYSDITNPKQTSGFVVRLVGPGNSLVQLSGNQFTYTGYNLPKWSDAEKVLEIKAQANFLGQTLNLHLFYRALAGQNFIEKWLTLDPNPALNDWVVRFIHVEETPVAPKLRATAPTPDEERVPLREYSEEASNNIPGGAIFTKLMVHENGNEGFYFFSANALGGEYATDKKVVMLQEEYQALSQGFTSGKAVIGVYTGLLDVGYKRYNEYLANQYSLMARKRQPIWYSTWYPFTTDINQDLILGQLEAMKKLGVYDVLHIDAGWESNYPLQIDTKKFPQGFKPIVEKGKEANISLGIWINPFSNSYQRYVDYSGMHRDHPEWHVPGRTTRDPKGFDSGPFGINTPYYDYVREKLVDLVKNNNIRVIYWDGADWNIPDASAPGLTEDQRKAERAKATKRLVALVDELHVIRPDLVIVGWNATADVHLLSAVDQLQLSDVWELPLGESEISRLQQFYAATYHLPYYAVWGDWYSISYKENKDNNLNQPLSALIYAESSMIGSGATIAGGSLDLTKAPPGLLDHIRKLFNWRRQFEKYFQVYQHILEAPSDDKIFGEAHVVNGEGFLLLNNPTDKPLQIIVPLAAPELELDPNKSYRLYDWSSLADGQDIGQAKPGEGVTVTVPPKSVKIIGININSFPAVG